jgi:hypothetical protein
MLTEMQDFLGSSLKLTIPILAGPTGNFLGTCRVCANLAARPSLELACAAVPTLSPSPWGGPPGHQARKPGRWAPNVLLELAR